MRARNVAATVAICLVLLWLVPPAYVATKIACATGEQQFRGPARDGQSGLTDFTQDVSEATAIRLLAERRLSYFEQTMQGSAAPLRVLVGNATSDEIARLAIVPRNPMKCLSGDSHLRSGLLYDLFTYGMQPSECLEATTEASSSGRFALRSRHEVKWGAALVEYQLVDQTALVGTSSIVSARSRRLPSTYGGAVLDSLSLSLETSCRADPQTVVDAFLPSKTRDAFRSLPVLRALPKQEATRRLPFVRSSLRQQDLRALLDRREPHSLVIAGKPYRALIVRDREFAAHWGLDAWIGCNPTLLALDDVVLVLGWEPTGLIVSVVSPAEGVTSVFAATLESSAEPLQSDGGCGGVVAATRGDKLFVLAYPKGSKSLLESTAVFEADLQKARFRP